MMKISRLEVVLASLFLACSAPEERRAPTSASAPERGVTLVEVGAGSALARAGIEPGTEVQAWRPATNELGARPAEEVLVRSPFDLLELEHEVIPRGAVDLRVDDGNAERWLPIPNGRWYVESRPALDLDEREIWESTQTDGEARLHGAALAGVAHELEVGGRPADAAWLHLRALRLVDEGAEADAERAALVAARTVGDAITLGWTWQQIAADRIRREDYSAARAALEEARSAWASEPDRLATSELHYWLGEIAGRMGDPAREEAHHRDGLELRQRLAPGSLAEARSWMRVAGARSTQDDVPGALDAAGRAFELSAVAAPGGFDHQNSLILLGIFRWFEEEWDVAEGYLREALRMIEALDPAHGDVGVTLANLAIVASSRGDLAASDEYHHQALARYEALGADSKKISRILNNLANNATERRDFAAAERYHRRSLASREQLSEDSIDVANALLNLGNMLVKQGRYGEAETNYRRALELYQHHVPGTRDVARTLGGLGTVRHRQGDLEEAEGLLRESVERIGQVSAASVLGADFSRRLGAVLAERGAFAEAERRLEDAAETMARLAPGTVHHALALHALGRLQRERGRPREALEILRRAVDALEVQLRSLGGSAEDRSAFRAAHLDLYRDQLELLLELQDAEAAFEVLERSKARSLLVLLRERGVDVLASASGETSDRIRELTEAYDEVQARLAETLVDGGLEGDSDTYVRQLAELRRQRAAAWDGARRESPALERADPPHDAEVAMMWEALGSDTVALSYSVGDDSTHLFIVGPGDRFRHAPLSVGAAELGELVERFRLLVERLPPSVARDNHRALGAELFGLLIRPAAAEIEAASRVLISPDGPLHLLPFSALTDAPRDVLEPGGRYLVEWKPLFQADSLAVYNELTSRPVTAEASATLVAFGDPAWERGSGSTSGPGAAGRDVSPLPYSRTEVEGLMKIYGRSGQGWIGRDATEERAKRLTGALGGVHYATHAFVDHTSPLDSGLLLAASKDSLHGYHNGVLQAWEILEEVSLDADLVALSACETGGGPVVAGEGLQSLTRAFQVAGARSVLASLWQVSDRSSAELMLHFYRQLRAGGDKSEALRTAQLALVRGDASHPYHWAAFQLYGDPAVRSSR